MAVTDLAVVTGDIKMRCARVAMTLDHIAKLPDPIFGDPRGVMLDLILADDELGECVRRCRRAWWP